MLNDTRFYIPTRGRVDRQLTLSNLPTDIVQSCVTLVCPVNEVAELRTNYPGVRILAQPEYIQTIGAKRAWIYEWHEELGTEEWAYQLDDDLTIKVRTGNYASYRITRNDPETTHLFFHEILPYMQGMYPVVGLGTSYFAPKQPVRENYHLGFFWGMNSAARSVLKMNRMDVFEDIDYTLQLLKAGQRIALLYDCVVDQKQADAPGGVTGERNAETIQRDLEKLVKLHRDCVTPKEAKPGAHPAAVTRVNWRRAAKLGGLV